GPGRELRSRYLPGDVSVFTPEEARRFVPRGDGDPRTDVVLAWELLYRLDPALYDRLAAAARLPPRVGGRLPRRPWPVPHGGSSAGWWTGCRAAWTRSPRSARARDG